MQRRVIIIGGLGNGTVIADAIAHAAGSDRDPLVAGFLNDHTLVGDMIGSYPVLGGTCDIAGFIKDNYSFVYTILRIDGQDERLRLFDSLNIPDEQLFTFVHPKAYVAPGVKIGCGTVIMPNASISSDTILGKGCLVMVNASIGHNTHIGDFCHFAAQSCISSCVKIETGVHIGLNATVREGLHLKAFSTLGMGSVLLKNMDEREIWVGYPAKFLREAE